MQLTYRAARYTMIQSEMRIPIVDASSNQITSRYRGGRILIQLPGIQHYYRSAVQLNYRGVPYTGLH